ncbi:type IV pilus assembly protein PilC [Pseudomonas sp. ok272]|uniref:type II secretion system F family protein n=1 Tax=unclassified Pseudomonas TaxID=196821 RepID=UPI0008CEA9D2|nr:MULTISPECIES: type II secretion system F family protein [unclassified Pseudomonas]SEM92214.1 type IV pilus assembly protein PilC [Pseudomonas sp. ok272]SFM95965.1 type IV pilus assembly protein PilC [Pseudomonas sp. ok602]
MAAKINRYAWEGTHRTGRKVSGELHGRDPALIRLQLRREGITPAKVRRQSTSLFGAGKRISAQDIALFTRQLATMVKAGVPLLQTLGIIADGVDKPNMRTLVTQLKRAIEGGNSLAGALRKQPRYFDELYCNLIDAGEQAGALDTLLERVATYKEQSEHLKARIKKAMTYPLAVVLVAIIVSSLLLIKVVPQFQSVFAGLGAELPAFTLLVIGLSDWMRAGGWLLLGGLLVAVPGVRHLRQRSPGVRDWLDRRALKLPLVGTLLHQSAIARYARTLSTTFAAGVPLVQALHAVAGATGNSVFRHAVLGIKGDVAAGLPLHVAMRSSGVFPGMAIQLTAIGEESGALDTLLDKLANYYEAQVDTMVDNLSSLLEPLIMVILGLIVGALVVAMYLPIFQLGAAI